MNQPFTIINNTTFFFRPLREEDLDEVVALCDRCVGKNLYSKDELSKAITSKDRFFYLLETAEGETVGYTYYYLTNLESIAKFAKLDTELFENVCPSETKPIGKIQSVGLKKKYRGLGLAQQMMRFMLNRLQALSAEAVFIVCWKIGEVVPLKNALHECGFDYLSEAKKVWYNDTNLVCPICHGRCHCDAAVYYKLLDERNLR